MSSIAGRSNFDLLVVGAGPSGCVVAERAAAVLGLRVLLIDRRAHLAGNCYDHLHDCGVLVHAYGPHYFRTGDQELIRYLSRFTEWRDARYRVLSDVKGQLYPFPINLDTLERFFARAFTPETAAEFLAQRAQPIPQPRNCEEFLLARVGRELYEAFYLEYTRTQWGRHPRELDPSICARVPVRMSRDDRYPDAPFQKMPAAGYTAMFEKMITHPNIETRLGVEYRDLKGVIAPRIATVYCGAIDEYFAHALGRLPWRSLRFEEQILDVELAQPAVQINYTDGRSCTRSFEIKHVTGQHHARTVVTREVPRAEGEPFYPVPSPESRALADRYREYAAQEEREARVLFTGRLASYRYLDSDAAMLQALETFERVRTLCQSRAWKS